MKTKEVILAELYNVPEKTIIFSGRLYKEKFSSVMSEVTFAQVISRLYRSGELERVAKGVYCRPKNTRFGKVLPTEQEIVKVFTDKQKGILTGYHLYNLLGITTQISKSYRVYSAFSDEAKKTIGNVNIYRYNLVYSQVVNDHIILMELLHNYRNIQDINHMAFKKNIQELCGMYDQSVFEKIQKEIGYPKRTVAFLREALNYYHIPNTLNKYLSELSDYKIPRMEEIYAAS